MAVNRRILLRCRPVGLLTDGDVELVREPVGRPAEGEVLIKTLLLAMDPVTRVMLAADIGVMPPIPLGAAVRSFGVGEVVESRRVDLPPGAKVSGFFEWADYQQIGPDVQLGAHFSRLPDDVSSEAALTIYGHTAHAAYFGMIDVAGLDKGKNVLITGAAGAVGSVAGQIARIKGARVIGTASSAEKCHWLTSKLGFDGTIDYKSADLDGALGDYFPKGIDIIFDNVGGSLLEAAIRHVAPGVRVVLCGASSQYLSADPMGGNVDGSAVEAVGGQIVRFNAMDFVTRFDEASQKMLEWERGGKLLFPYQTINGLDRAPCALNSLFEGKNLGRLLVQP